MHAPFSASSLEVWLRFCLATIGVGVFRCGDFGCRTFLFLHPKKIQKGERKMFKKRSYESPEINFVKLTARDILTSSNNIDVDLGENDGEWM